MKKQTNKLIYPLIIMGVLLFFASSCDKDDSLTTKTYTISGKLFNSITHEAISNAHITFDDRSYTTSSSDGSFETKITKGNRLISVFAENYIVFYGFIDVNGDIEFDVVLEYKPGAGKSGVVIGNVNSSNADATTVHTAGFFIQADENGNYSLRLPEGTHEVMAMDDTGVSDAIEVTVSNNGVSSADLTVTDDDICYRGVQFNYYTSLGSYELWMQPPGYEVTIRCRSSRTFCIRNHAANLDNCIEKVVYDFSDGSPTQTVLANSGRIDYYGEGDGYFVLTSKPIGFVTVTATIHFNDGRTKTKQITQDWGTKYCDNSGDILSTIPVLTTTAVTDITQTTAISGGDITDDGGAEVTARGVVWSTSEEPTIANSDGITSDGDGNGEFTSSITDLESNTTYYVRAYATNSQGIAYGNQIFFISAPHLNSGEVWNPTTGKIWMDKNLGATRVAISSTDANAYGDLYQWGRGADGHQVRTSGTTSTLSSSNTPGHGSFILATSYPYDWRNPQNTNLWQGATGENNPCSAGFRLPTGAEWNEEIQTWNSYDEAGAFASTLKLTMAGGRLGSDGVIYFAGTSGRYWTSTIDGDDSRNSSFNNNTAGIATSSRSVGYTVRCIKN